MFYFGPHAAVKLQHHDSILNEIVFTCAKIVNKYELSIYIKALGLSNDNISLAYDVITQKDGVEWMESCNIAVEHI